MPSLTSTTPDTVATTQHQSWCDRPVHDQEPALTGCTSPAVTRAWGATWLAEGPFLPVVVLDLERPALTPVEAAELAADVTGLLTQIGAVTA